jgi:hypothetical protein
MVAKRIIKKVKQTIGAMMSLRKRYLTMTVNMAAGGVNSTYIDYDVISLIYY